MCSDLKIFIAELAASFANYSPNNKIAILTITVHILALNHSYWYKNTHLFYSTGFHLKIIAIEDNKQKFYWR